jgi:hypothetical protein
MKGGMDDMAAAMDFRHIMGDVSPVNTYMVRP